ncbi:MAG TPA: hypothetical protein VEX68_01755, partial [Bryobacteraceae bacterium]|nr:hypothetical protein [Bryobacteraceae bacterium]
MYLPRLQPSPVDVYSLAKVPLGNTASLPAEPGIYFAVDDSSRVWYAGIAECIRSRLCAHEKMDLFKQENRVTCIAWMTERDEGHRRELERKVIECFHPPFNLHHNFNQLPEIDLGLTPDQEITRFFELRAQLKLIELELEALKPNLVTRCQQQYGGKITHAYGSVHCVTTKSWEFSPDVEALKQKLSDAQRQEKETGVAKVKATKVSPVCKLNADALSR